MLTTNQQERNPTQRERLILTLMIEGHSTAEIAGLLGTTPHVIRNQVQHLRDRFAATNEALIAMAVRLEWIACPIEVRQDERQRHERRRQKQKADRD